jgi:DNA-binding GntR family transcriptional regulator
MQRPAGQINGFASGRGAGICLESCRGVRWHLERALNAPRSCRPLECDYLHVKKYYLDHYIQYTMRPRQFGYSRAAFEWSLPNSRRCHVGTLGCHLRPTFRLHEHMQNSGTPLRRKPLKDEVFDVVHQDILSGRYAAGSWLRQDEVAQRLGVSMTPVREALDLLVAAGLAERVAYRGVRVLQPSGTEILDAYEMRLFLEGMAARSAASSITADHLAILRAILEEGDRLSSLDDLPREREVSRALHMAIVSASGNGLLVRIYGEVLRAFPDWMLYGHLYRQPELLEVSIREEHREHRLIVEALADGNPEAALGRTVEHIVRRGRELETYLGIPREALRLREAKAARFLPQLENQIPTP